MSDQSNKPNIVIACGGTGGHLFPGLAVAQQFTRRNCTVTLIVSKKEVDQQALQNVWGMEIVTLPAVGLAGKNYIGFALALLKSFLAAKKLFKAKPPQAVLAMGGFTSLAPILAGKFAGAPTFLHESNAVPGRANRWLSHHVNRVFVGFSHAAPLFTGCDVTDIGMPVRAQFTPRDPVASLSMLGLDPTRSTLLIMGGSQGATAINDLLIQSLPHLVKLLPEFQFLHITGDKDEERVRRAYETHASGKFSVRPFLAEMQHALSAATVAVSRAGASSLAEIAALRVPTILIPYPAAVDNHQLYNARDYARTGAARLLEQTDATPEILGQLIVALARNATVRQALLVALPCWHRPRAAEAIADQILKVMRETKAERK